MRHVGKCPELMADLTAAFAVRGHFGCKKTALFYLAKEHERKIVLSEASDLIIVLTLIPSVSLSCITKF
jgi:hypothetical protein